MTSRSEDYHTPGPIVVLTLNTALVPWFKCCYPLFWGKCGVRTDVLSSLESISPASFPQSIWTLDYPLAGIDNKVSQVYRFTPLGAELAGHHFHFFQVI
ncbi:hypothetical protein VTJ04DRAFT_7062 [Mycothermus thermophilus]|uniref:uncharacterized protein n=1 Tax=Humicola insolens TaxID=85995 RepID=UPI00374439EA